jgi:hypothetical protein
MALEWLNPVSKILDKIIPDAAKRDEAKLAMMTLNQAGEFKDVELAFSAITAEAKSQDPWTSRARPSFLYVMYIFILSALPMGAFWAYDPTNADLMAKGVSAWLEALPPELYTLFGAGYLGYSKKRSDDKEVTAGMKPKKFLGLF